MANLSEDLVWKDGIYQLETTDPVVGGPEGIDNRQAKELASRTQYLKAQVELRATTVTVNALIAAAVDSILGSTPETLDTLNELAAALGDDPNFAATLTALIGTKLDTSSFTGAGILALLVAVQGAGSGLDADKLDGQQGSHYAPKASPALTGTPTAPTAVAGDSTTQVASTEFVQTEISNGLGGIDLSLYAPKASPALTGTPTAPTQVPGTNDTTLATTSFIQAALATLVASSPGTLDTLNELAAALGDDPNFATTMTALIGTKLDSSAFTATAIKTLLKTVDGAGSGIDADKLDGVQGNSYARKASPAFSGNPTAPTQTLGNNSTRLATTAFVKNAVDQLPATSISSTATTYTIQHSNGLVEMGGTVSAVATDGGTNITLPVALSKIFRVTATHTESGRDDRPDYVAHLSVLTGTSIRLSNADGNITSKINWSVMGEI